MRSEDFEQALKVMCNRGEQVDIDIRASAADTDIVLTNAEPPGNAHIVVKAATADYSAVQRLVTAICGRRADELARQEGRQH